MVYYDHNPLKADYVKRPRFLGDKVIPGMDDQKRAEAEKGYTPPGAAFCNILCEEVNK